MSTVRNQTVNIREEMERAYLDYAMSVIVARALPDVRDGLKPVHRRILYAMHDMRLFSDRPHRKSARIVGEVLGKYHPHGDAAVYDAMARMAQDFSMRYLLVDGQGNFGSVDGDSPAAMRYTEARMSPLAQELLVDIGKDTVDFADSFDGTLEEPTVLPARLPNLLLTGASGIAVGMSTNIPPHNLGEICDTLCYLIDTASATDGHRGIDEVSVEDLMRFIQGPDFPTGGLIYRYGQHDGERVDTIRRAYATGRGRIVMQAKTHVEEMSRGRSRIVVTELPYQVNKSRLIERIAELVRQERITGISDLRDESGRQGLRVVIELSRSTDPRQTLEDLFKQTQMRETFGVIMLALVDGEPRLLPLKRCLLEYIAHRQEVIARRSRHELEQARQRAHILEGLRIALNHLDAVIDTIRRSREPRTARSNLRHKFKLSEDQAEAVLSMPLRRLARMERARVEEEYNEVSSRISYLEDLLASPAKIMRMIKEELQELKGKYGDGRRTQIVEREERGYTQADFAPQEKQVVVLTVETIQRVPADEFSFRRSTGITSRTVRGHLTHLEADPHDTVLFLTNRGRGLTWRVFRLPGEEGPTSQLIPLEQGEDVIALLALPPEEESEKSFLVLATAQGQVKRTCVADLSLLEQQPGEVLRLGDGDELCFGRVSSGAQEVLLVSSRGQVIRFSEDEVRPQVSPSARGVIGIKLGKADAVVGVALVDSQDQGELVIVSAQGYLKRTRLQDYPPQRRSGRGVRTASLNRRTGNLVTAAVLRPGQKLSILSQEGRRAYFGYEDVPRMGRSTQGRKLANFGRQDAPERAVVF
jgi:DNA gyrase subunit A